jgi:hypothetical protein
VRISLGDRASVLDLDDVAVSFRVLDVYPLAGGWMMLRGYVIHAPDVHPPIGPPEVRVLHERHVRNVVHDW